MSTLPIIPSPWLYVESTGCLYRPDGSFAGAGYSGRGDGINNPAFQTVKDVGPIPCGLYTFAFVDKEKGPSTIHLTPDPANDMHGRAGFLMHGDNSEHDHTASEGCIIMGPTVRSEVVETAIGDKLKVIDKPVAPEQVT